MVNVRRVKANRPLAPVLHVVPFLWSGAGAVITRLCEAQLRQRRVTLVTTGTSAGLSDWPAYRRRLRRAGVRHVAIDFFHRDQSSFFAGVTRLAALIRDIEPAVVHAHAGVPSAGAVMARAISGRRPRVIGQMYSWGLGRPPWMDVQDACGFAQTERVLCSARGYWDLLVRHGVPARKLTYLPWGLPLQELPWRGLDRPSRNQGPLLGFVGRIEPRKGQLALVEALARIRRTLPAARLELIGPVADEAYAAAVRAAVATHGLEDAVRLRGKVRDVTSHLRRWDLFVSMSSDEGQGLAVLEAMAIGAPVVALRVAGIADFLIDQRTGLVIPEASAAGVCSAVSNAWNRRTSLSAIARRARALVERRYAWEHTVTTLERLYRA
jgi:glycosyltransferase involved in cell wall biosynthesis